MCFLCSRGQSDLYLGLQIDQMGEGETRNTKRVLVGKPAGKGCGYGLQGNESW